MIIKPKGVTMYPEVSVRFNIEDGAYEEGDSWSVEDPEVGTIKDQGDGTAIYTQLAVGETTVRFTKAGGAFSTATAFGIQERCPRG